MDLAEQQLRAIQQFHHIRRTQEKAAHVVSDSREMRARAKRELEIMRRGTDALIARSEQQLRGSGRGPLGTATRTALLVHRNQWYLGKVSAALRDGGCAVLPYVHNGADAVGIAAAEQPDLIFVEDALEMLTGDEVIRRIRTLCPHAIMAAQVAYSDSIVTMTDAGAVAVFTRQVPPAEVAQGLLRLLGTEQPPRSPSVGP